MSDFYEKEHVVRAEDLLDGCDFITQFATELGECRPRLTSSELETAAARLMRDRLHEETGAKTRLEAYRAYPMLGRLSCLFVGLWYALSLVLYLISFAGGRLAGILLTLLALAVFLTGSAVFGSLFFGRRTFKGILSSKVAYNVVSERNPKLVERGKERTVVICACHDDMPGSFFDDFGLVRKISLIAAPLSALLFVFFCLLKMGIGTDTAGKISTLTVLPFLTSIVGIFVLVTHFSLSPKRARENNGVAASVALAVYAYFVEKQEELPSDVKLVFASFGGESAGHGGSKAFFASHPELENAHVLCLGNIESGAFRISTEDALRKIKFSDAIANSIRQSAARQGIECETADTAGLKNKLNSLHGYIAGSFAEGGARAAEISAKDYGAEGGALNREDIEKLFCLTVGAVKNILEDDND